MKIVYLIVLAAMLLSFSSYSQIRQATAYKECTYYSLDGEKNKGYAKFKYADRLFTSRSKGGCQLIFVTDEGFKPEKLGPKDIKGFILAKDSFTVLHNLKVGEMLTYSQDFVRVLETGRINLYIHYSSVQVGNTGTRAVYTWIIDKDQRKERLNNKFFKKELSKKYFQDYPELEEKISYDLLTYDLLRLLIQLYNKKFADGEY